MDILENGRTAPCHTLKSWPTIQNPKHDLIQLGNFQKRISSDSPCIAHLKSPTLSSRGSAG
jgi:hypothetical protein